MTLETLQNPQRGLYILSLFSLKSYPAFSVFTLENIIDLWSPVKSMNSLISNRTTCRSLALALVTVRREECWHYFTLLIRWWAKWQGHAGGGVEPEIYSDDNKSHWKILYDVACKDQTLWFVSLSHSKTEFVLVLSCFSLTNWSEDSHIWDAGHFILSHWKSCNNYCRNSVVPTILPQDCVASSR